MENSINGNPYRHILLQRGGCARRYGPGPNLLFLHSYKRVAAKQHCKIRETQNFYEIILNFVKFRKIRGKFCGTRNLIFFLKKFAKLLKQKFSLQPYSYTICCTNSCLLKHYFAMRQCYFEMKPIQAPQFSILSSFIL